MDAVTCLESGAGLQVVFPLTPDPSPPLGARGGICMSQRGLELVLCRVISQRGLKDGYSWWMRMPERGVCRVVVREVMFCRACGWIVVGCSAGVRG